MSVQFLTIDPEQAQQRIDNFLLRRLKGVPKSHIYRILRKGEVRVNKKRIKASYKLQAGDYVRIPPIKVAAPAQPMVLNKSFLDDFAQHILYEDKGLLVINKPSGLAVHGGSGVKLGVIEVVRQLRPDCKNLELVHRLDRETSGCLLIAKKRSVLRELHELLREKQVVKHYLALVKGRVRKKIIVDAPLQKSILRSGERIVVVDPAGKASVTTFEPLCHHDGYTLVKATPETGRTHQIRVHAAHAGYPIAGDEKYGDVDFNKKLRHQGCKRLFLHAESLTFKLSSTEENFNIEAPLQSALQKFLPFSG